MTDNITPSPEPAAPATVAPVAAKKTNVLAIVSFVLGLLSFNIIAVILGHVALSQIKKTGDSGRVFAIIGLILGYIGIVFWVIIIIVVSVAAATGNVAVTTN